MKKLAITLLTIFSLFAISCEIGLGSSVDTEPPALDILTPKVDAIIRDNFVISGTWSDDGTIASISIKLERTDGNGTPKQYDGTFVENPQKRGSGTWTVEIPAVKDKIIDGTYQAVVTIKDTTSRTTTQSTTLSIDNTAPIIVLQRPGTKLNETPDAYGQTFTLNGMGADDNSIDHIDINIYSDKECTNLLKTITKSNVPPTIELDVAVFEDGKENDYSTIYGSTSKNGEQTRYCKITAYDNAKRYPLEGESTASDEVGNSTSDYYLYDDIYDSILDHYTITEVYKMLSGAYLLADSSRSADTVTEVKNLLEQFKITQGNFSLNPENSPQFIVNGRDPLTGSGTDFDGADYNITSDTSVVIEIATGLDGIPLDAPTLRPYVLLCDKFGAPVEEDKPENRIYLAAAGSGTKSGTSYKYTVNLNHTTPYEGGKYIILGNTYIFRVEGCDKNKNTIIPKGGTYGFKLSSNGAAPGLTVESPSESISRVGKNGKKTFSGIVTCQDGLPTIKIKNGEEIIWSKTFSSADIVPANGVQKFTFSYDIDYNGVTENSQIQYSIVASLGDLETTAFKTIIYDKDSPVIDVNSLLPMATKYYTSKNDSVYTDANPYDEQNPYTEDNYLNGTVTLKISVNDEYDSIETKEDEKKPYFEVIDGDSGEVISLKVGAETEAATKHLITTLINGSYKIDTTQIQTGSINKGIKFRIYAWDRAGNETIYTYPETTGTDSPVLKVNQDTDKPVILPARRDLSLTYTSKEARDAAPSRRSQIPSGGQLLLTLIDDDGIAGYKIFKVKYGDPAAQSTSSTEAFLTASDADNYFTSQDANVTEIDGNASTQLPVSEACPSSAGYYWYKIVVRDINDVVSETEPFIIKTTSQAPKLMSVTAVESDPGDSAVGKYVGGSDSSKKKWENKIEIDSSEHPFYIYRREQAFGEEFDPDSTNPQVGQDSLVCITDASEYSDIIENPSENKKYYYKVYDGKFH